ncbi:MAG: hypothetical protein H6627_07180 [Calditrichae bacterium]|nr:hypothetical protein [Calditrichota bacterium]MCB9058331.1 hypothetical protein [Calditrichia bacterium]
MIQLRNKLKAWPKWTLLAIALFTITVGFSGFAHNHAPGMESPDCPAYFVQHYFNAEYAVIFIFSFFLLIIAIYVEPKKQLETKFFIYSISSRAPPFSY